MSVKFERKLRLHKKTFICWPMLLLKSALSRLTNSVSRTRNSIFPSVSAKNDKYTINRGGGLFVRPNRIRQVFHVHFHYLPRATINDDNALIFTSIDFSAWLIFLFLPARCCETFEKSNKITRWRRVFISFSKVEQQLKNTVHGKVHTVFVL